MKELISTVTSKGQVTIPIEVQLSTHEKVALIVQDDQVRLARRGVLFCAPPACSKPINPPSLLSKNVRQPRKPSLMMSLNE